MAKLNHHYQKLPPPLLADMQTAYSAAQIKAKDASWIDLSTADISDPLAPSVMSALRKASEEMGNPMFLKGYGPAEGYSFLREAISFHDYGSLGIRPDEIFISNGARSDLSHLQEIFDAENTIATLDPSYPLYLETNVMAGRTKPLRKSGGYGGVTYLAADEATNFQPKCPRNSVDLVYLCSPNNPTGVALSRTTLQEWVTFAKEHKAILLIDGSYEAYIQSPDAPHSIYEIEGAKEVAIEVRSFSKKGGFTNLRCSYTVVPHALKIRDAGRIHSVHSLWKRRQDTKFSGVPYPVQRAAAALYTPEGKEELALQVNSLQQRSRRAIEKLTQMGQVVYGGKDAPLIWWKVPKTFSSWEFYLYLLDKAHLVVTPGTRFGMRGEGFVRLSAFGKEPLLNEAIERIKGIL